VLANYFGGYKLRMDELTEVKVAGKKIRVAAAIQRMFMLSFCALRAAVQDKSAISFDAAASSMLSLLSR